MKKTATKPFKKKTPEDTHKLNLKLNQQSFWKHLKTFRWRLLWGDWQMIAHLKKLLSQKHEK